eukprot:214204-Amorphochlora_amoeboformis.AAC.1
MQVMYIIEGAEEEEPHLGDPYWSPNFTVFKLPTKCVQTYPDITRSEEGPSSPSIPLSLPPSLPPLSPSPPPSLLLAMSYESLVQVRVCSFLVIFRRSQCICSFHITRPTSDIHNDNTHPENTLPPSYPPTSPLSLPFNTPPYLTAVTTYLTTVTMFHLPDYRHPSLPLYRASLPLYRVSLPHYTTFHYPSLPLYRASLPFTTLPTSLPRLPTSLHYLSLPLPTSPPRLPTSLAFTYLTPLPFTTLPTSLPRLPTSLAFTYLATVTTFHYPSHLPRYRHYLSLPPPNLITFPHYI